jgi:hypothetical protein
MDVVFANRHVLASHPKHGGVVELIEGGHYLADDPIVTTYPDLFTDDPRFGLRCSDPLEADGLPAWADRSEPEPEEQPAPGPEPEQQPEQQPQDGDGSKDDGTRTAAPAVETADATPGTKRTRARTRAAKGDEK